MKFIASLFFTLATMTVSACGNQTSKDPNADQPQVRPTDRSRKSEVSDQTGPGVAPIKSNKALAAMGPLLNYKTITEQIGLTPFHQHNLRGNGIRIAVLDNGFLGWQEALGTRLPSDTILDNGTENAQADTTHGTRMAEIAYAVARGQLPVPNETGIGPQVKLYNTNGFTNFSHAIDQIITDKVDVVLYSQVWEYSGNGDGKGFINALVNRAIEHGIIWVNAAGNNGESTYQTKILTPENSQAVSLPFKERYVRLVVPQNETPVRIVLSWNDFTDSQDYKTSKDLDLRLSDCDGGSLATSSLIQSGDEPAGREGYSAHAREIIQTTLSQGTYCLSVQRMTDNFDVNSTLRLTADGYGVTFTDRSAAGQLLIPADNSETLTVGASDVSYSATAFATAIRGRDFDRNALTTGPDVKVASSVNFGGDETYSGTSAAAAIAAGAVAVLRGSYGSQLNKTNLTQHLSQKVQVGAERPTRRERGSRDRSPNRDDDQSGNWQSVTDGFIWNPPSLFLTSPF